MATIAAHLSLDDDGLQMVAKAGRGDIFGVRKDNGVMESVFGDSLCQRDDAAVQKVKKEGHMGFSLILFAENDDIAAEQIHDGIARKPNRGIQFLLEIA